MRVKLALLADYANVTAYGKLNILGVFDRINVTAVPAVHPQSHRVLRFEAHAMGRDRVHNVEIRLHDPDGKAVFEVKGDVVSHGTGRATASHQILTLNNLHLTKSGDYTFAVFVNDDLKSELPLGVEVAPAGARSEEHTS